MTKRHKDFGAKQASTDEPVTFTLDGEDFTCRPRVQGGLILKFVHDADSDSGGKAAGALTWFIRKALVKDDRERFDTLLEDEDRLIDVETIGEVAAWLMEMYAGRPTGQQGNSSSSQSKNGRTSTAEREPAVV